MLDGVPGRVHIGPIGVVASAGGDDVDVVAAARHPHRELAAGELGPAGYGVAVPLNDVTYAHLDISHQLLEERRSCVVRRETGQLISGRLGDLYAH